MFGRRETLENIEEQPHLDPIGKKEVETVEDLTAALEDLSVKRLRSPPADTVEKIQRIHGQLPEEAKPEYAQDDLLRRRINAARNQFNDWIGRQKRSREIPSPVEAGRSKYPYKKARRRSRLAREATEELDEAIEKVDAAAGGARQRALEAIGSSVAEQNEKRSKSKRERRRDQLQRGDIVAYRSPSAHLGAVIRVNKKSIRVRRPNPRAGQTKPLSDEPEPEFVEGRIDLDTDFLERVPPERIDELPECVDIQVSVPEDFPSTFQDIQERLLGEVVNDHPAVE